LNRHTKHEVKLLDCPADEIDYTKLEKTLIDFAPHIIGITGHTHNIADMLKVSTLYKKLNPEGVAVWGGAHASAFPEKSAGFETVDYVIYGEGEASFKKLADFLSEPTGFPEHIGGLVYKKEGNPVKNPPADYIMNLDELPHPRREILDIRKYFYTVGSGQIASSFVSSRGCPYQCTFCSTPGKTFRCRSAKDVADEMEKCQEMGIRELYFVDDTFNVDKDRVTQICKEIIRRKIDIIWNYRGRINLITQEQLELAQKAGCTRIQLGVETGTDEGMAILKKGLKTDQVREVFKWLKKTKISSAAYFMIGCPHEKTRDDVLKTIEFAKEIDPDYVLFGILTPYPDTEIYDEGVKKGIIDPQIWENFVTNPSAGFKPQTWTEFLSQEELEEMLDIAYKKFYGRPGYMLKRLTEIRSAGELWNKVKAGLNILK
jgi:radical SAM superfamily enzyme YgiQ (UPF0313 family)